MLARSRDLKANLRGSGQLAEVEFHTGVTRGWMRPKSVGDERVMDGLRHNLAIFDDKRISSVSDAVGLRGS